jgi:hypothetical protein
MAIPREELTRWIFGASEVRRYTQDSPILPDVWLAYGEAPSDSLDLLLTPHADSTAAELAAELARELGGAELEGDYLQSARLAYSESYVVVTLSFEQLIRFVLPLSRWWYARVWPHGAEPRGGAEEPREWRLDSALGSWIEGQAGELLDDMMPGAEWHRSRKPTTELAWLIGLVGRIAEEALDGKPGTEPGEDLPQEPDEARRVFELGAQMLGSIQYDPERAHMPLLWAVSRNRRASTALWRSTRAIKSDAVARLFDSSCGGLRWAVIDSGVDATHPAFRRRDECGVLAGDPFAGNQPKLGTRVVASYDFTRLRRIVAPAWPTPRADPADLKQIEARLRRGRTVDWDSLEPLLRVDYDEHYEPPVNDHGTHVAGILAADWRTSDEDMPIDHDLIGVCPDIEIYSLRVFDDRGTGDEFAIGAALQFIRYLNSNSDLQVIHGVNLSLSLAHDVANYAVGRTPVCDECERLVGTGVCVVTVAGNDGRARYEGERGFSDGYRTVSITDPGNADGVITVGATHRYEPHTYGVSYFSSRGPTGDGRPKPDLVAPGEKINSTVPNAGYKAKDGTSQAAPHVSGAAALLMARYDELRGQPERIKQILCDSASDLGRDRYFQGAGMLDVLRAMQSV